MNGPSNQQPTDFSENDKIQNLSPSVSRRGFIDHESLRSPTWTASIWQFLTNYYPLVVSITCALIIGAPVAAATNDPRILDGCMLWFIWYSTVKAQLWLKNNTRWNVDPRLKRISVTMLNPVLMTTLLTLAYTRLRTLALSANLTDILRNFSRGTPLYAIWTSSVTGSELPRNPDHFFGAGDLALSLLECGLVIWGFKLYECRRQLFSFAGLLTAILSIGVAAGNVFFSAVIAHGLGLAQSEALAFSARSTTLALAKPAIDAVHGNLAVNAALVVSNGILGQLMYAYVLPALKAESDDTEPNASATPTSTDINAVEAQHGSQTQPAQMKRYDTPATIATGIAVGINGAAMGVAYLYENKSRAAPYAALSMTVFGVFTVLFITVEPMKSVLIAITA